MRALTDSGEDITFDESTRPGLAALLSLFALMQNKTPDAVAHEYARIRGLCQFKVDLATCLIEYLSPFRNAYLMNMSDPGHIESVLAEGSRTARQIAQSNLEHLHMCTNMPVLQLLHQRLTLKFAINYAA
ncbi:Tryptophan--tRNA ligase [Paramicrosporidium saccamoebae]|uniref:Tryptophan--tRNA ligase n=1 Tax=Paramicrosporidium saccamoebae TaxID=1246581 RepID=A0A2H9THB5_9FUNG|nr:Tryptophan--tRNA ligase [Paramicrosporidium saccamoebae]